MKNIMERKDCLLAALSGMLIGILLLPIINAAKPDFLNFPFGLSIFILFTVATPLGVFIASLIAQKIPVVWQIAKFGVTGVLNFLVDLGVLSLLTFILKNYFQIESSQELLNLGFFILTAYSIYKATSFIIANINSYFWNKFWTFEKNSTKKTSAEFAQFFTVSIIGFFINVLVASYVFGSFSMPGLTPEQWGLIGAAVGSIAGLIWNFLGYKFIVFKK